MRPELSVTGTRWTRCGPPSNLRWLQALSPLHHERDLVEPAQVREVGGEHLDRPAHAGGEGLVHLEEVAGEQVGLLAALRAPDLDDDVLAVVGVGGDQEHLQLLLEARQLLLGGVDLRRGPAPARRRWRRPGARGRPRGRPRGRGSGGRRDDQGVQVLVPLRRTAQAGGVAEHSRIGELRLHGFVLGLQALQAIQHGGRLRGANRRRHGHDLGRRTQEGGQPAGDRVVIAFGNGEDEPGSTSERQAGIRPRTAPGPGRYRPSTPRRPGGRRGRRRSPTQGPSPVPTGNGWRRRLQPCQADEARVAHEAVAQRPPAGQPVERVGRRARSAVGGDRLTTPANAAAIGQSPCRRR